MFRTAMLCHFALVALVLTTLPLKAQQKPTEPISKGQNVLSSGHSFHVWVPAIVAELCKKAKIEGHKVVGVSSIGGSRVIQHWDLPDEKNIAKNALKKGGVDVLTMSPIYLPDAGIENFTKLALEHNKDIRIIVQPIWLRADADETQKVRTPLDRDGITIEELRKRHENLFQMIEEHVKKLNKEAGRTVLYIAPAPQAVIALREKIVAGKTPGLSKQSDLFTDAVGHGTPTLMALVGYVNYATIYRRSPVGLEVPEVLKKAKIGDNEENLNRLLQELAWDAVTKHPLSGVTATKE